jgi:2-(1,2-epoxy-1,2-dihydrophenyl)acetyl-CoA isomerase
LPVAQVVIEVLPSRLNKFEFFGTVRLLLADARRAEGLGLINRVVPDAELRGEAFAIAKTLANGPSSTYASMKDNLDLALSADFLTSLDQEAEKMVAAAGTAQHAEAVRAFMEKRAPNYR